MKRILFLIVLLSICVWVGLKLPEDRAMLIVTLGGWRIDLPLWLTILIAAVGAILLYYIFIVVNGILNLSKRIKARSKRHQQKRAKVFTQQGLFALAQGEFETAEKSLVQGAQHYDMPWINYLGAAKAAHELGAERRQHEYYQRAKESVPESEDTILLTKATMQFENGKYEQSLLTLSPLKQQKHLHRSVLRLLQKIYVKQKVWAELLQLIPALKRQHVLSKENVHQLEILAWSNLFSLQHGLPLETLHKLWKSLPKALRLEGDIALSYAAHLQYLEKPIEATEVLYASLKENWREDLIRYFGDITHPAPDTLLRFAENWLKKHPHSPALLLTLGKISEQLQLWGKAQHYFEASLALKPDPETYAHLGKLLEKMNKPELGNEYFKKGLLIATHLPTNN